MFWWPFCELISKYIFMVHKYLNEDIWWEKIQIFSKAKFRSNKWLKIMLHHMSAVEFVGVKI